MYNDEGNKEFEKGEFHNAVYFYTEGIKVKCKDDELNAKLYRKRASAYKQIGKICVRFRVTFLLYLRKQKIFITCIPQTAAYKRWAYRVYIFVRGFRRA